MTAPIARHLVRCAPVLMLLLAGGCSTFRGVMPEPLGDVLRAPGTPRTVRVALARNAESARVRVAGPGVIYDAAARRRLRAFSTLNDTVFTADARGVLMGGTPLGSRRVAIMPDMPRTLWVNGTQYRGDATLVAQNPGALTVVNTLGLEEYLMSVVPKETYASWPEAAVRAQAVAARSFAVNHMRTVAAAAEFDVIAPTHQLYGGVGAEDPRSTKAVLDTEGEILWFNGDVLCTFFHTTCGGRTEDASNIFTTVSAYPRAVLSPYEKDSPYHSWRHTIALVNCEEKLRQAGKAPGGPIEAVQIVRRFPSGRVAQVRFASRNASVIITGEECRRILGYDNVRSTWFNVGIRSGRLEFAGRGWGHGVGLCQWSSKGMAERGFGYEKILLYFYPGAQLRQIPR